MPKKKIALLMAAIMMVSSVCPSGSVLAEDAAVAETTMEAAVIETSRETLSPENEFTAIERNPVSGEQPADNSIEQLPLDSEGDFADEEDMISDDEEILNREDVSENPDGDAEESPADNIEADGELSLDLSDTGQTLSLTAADGQENLSETVQSIKIKFPQDGICDIFDDLEDRLCSSEVTITYAGDSGNPLFINEWCEATITYMGREHNVLRDNTGASIYMFFFDEDEIVDIPQCDEDMNPEPKEYTIKLFKCDPYKSQYYKLEGTDGQSSEWKITTGIPESTEELTTEEGLAQYELGNYEHTWYKMTGLRPGKEYAVKIEKGYDEEDEEYYSGTYGAMYKKQNTDRFPEYVTSLDDSSAYVFTAEENTIYWVVLRLSFDYDYTAGTVSLKQKREVISAKLEVTESSYDVFTCDEYAKLAEAMQPVLTVTYDDQTIETIEGQQWKLQNSKGEVETSDMSGLRAVTKNGDQIKLNCYSQGTSEQVDWPAGKRWIRPGLYTIMPMVGEKEYKSENKSIAIEIPNCNALTSGEEQTYTVDEGKCQWFSYTPKNDESGEYVLQHKDDSETWYELSYLNFYTMENGILRRVSRDNASSISFRIEQGKTYYAVLYREGFGQASGTVCVKPRAVPEKVELTGIKTGDTIDAYDLYEKLRSMTADIHYSGSGTESIHSWDNDVYTGAGYNQELSHTTENGDIAYLTLWSGEDCVDIPRDNKDESIPIGDNYTIKLIVGEKTCKVTNIHIGASDPDVLTADAEPSPYRFAKNEHRWYTFTPNTPGKHIVKLKRSTGYGNSYLVLYKKAEYAGASESLDYMEDTESDLSPMICFEAEKGVTYYIALINEVYDWEDEEDDAQSETENTGTICVKKQLGIKNITLKNLPANGFCDICASIDTMGQVQATILYDDGKTSETVSGWKSDFYHFGWYYDDEEEEWDYEKSAQAMSVTTENGNTLYLTLWDEQGIADALWCPWMAEGEENGFLPGKYEIKVFADNEASEEEQPALWESGPEAINIGIPDDSSTLGGLEEKEYQLQPGGTRWYKFVGEPGEYIVKNSNYSYETMLYMKKADNDLLYCRMLDMKLGMVPFTASEGWEYWIVIQALEESSGTGRISIVTSEHEHQFREETVDATCTTDGVRIWKCSTCGFIMKSEVTAKATGHAWAAGQIAAEATVKAAAQRQYECSKCHARETRSEGKPLPATIAVPAVKANMKTGQKTSVFNVTMAAGDSIASVISSNTKLMRVSSINKTKGTFKLKAGKKTGKVKITVRLVSGKSQTITLTVQKKKVTTKKVKVAKKLVLKKGARYNLKPVITPITTQDKVRFMSSSKKIATVSNKGVIKARKTGKVTITVICGKKKAKCKLTVTN